MQAQSNILLLTLDEQRSLLEAFLTRRLGCQSMAEDVLQSLSEKLLEGPSVPNVRNPKAYVFQVAANAAHSHARAARTRTQYEEGAAAVAESVDALDPERIVLGREALKVVENALKGVPVLSRRMFVLYRVEGMAQKEIADRYGVSLSTVEKRIAKVIKHCHRALTDDGFTGVPDDKRHRCEARPERLDSRGE